MRFRMSNVNINNGGQNSTLLRPPYPSCHSFTKFNVCVCMCRTYLARPLHPTHFRTLSFSLHTFHSISCVCRASVDICYAAAPAGKDIPHSPATISELVRPHGVRFVVISVAAPPKMFRNCAVLWP